jgi:hypothetical protein
MRFINPASVVYVVLITKLKMLVWGKMDPAFLWDAGCNIRKNYRGALGK